MAHGNYQELGQWWRGTIVEYGDISTRDYRATVTGIDGMLSAPERAYEAYDVPGRSGALVIDGGRYANQPVTFTLAFRSMEDMGQYRADVMSLPSAYRKLRVSSLPDEYRMAIVGGEAKGESLGMRGVPCELSVTFSCKPQRWLDEGDVPVDFTADGSLWNIGSMPSKPLIRAYGAGTLGVGDCTVTIAAHGSQYMDIDCEMQDCFCGAANLNGFATFSRQEFPELRVGSTGIKLGEGVTKATVWPRWWRL